jgi:hypothetical protein
MIEKDFLPTNAATSGNGSKPVTAESRIRFFNPLKIRQGGSSERGRVSEYMEESPRLLARPSSQSLGIVSRREDVPSRRGIRGAETGIPERRRKLSSLWLKPVKPV